MCVFCENKSKKLETPEPYARNVDMPSLNRPSRLGQSWDTLETPEPQTKKKRTQTTDNDRIGQFVADSCEINVGDTRGDIASVVYSEYVAFSRQSGFTPKSAPELTKWFEKKGIAKVRSRRGYDDGNSSQWRYQGVRLKTTYRIA